MCLVVLSGCFGIGFDKGLYYEYEKNSKYRYSYDFQSKSLRVESGNGKVNLTVYRGECGDYGMIGIVIPLIPVWSNRDCTQNVAIGISNASSAYIVHHNKVYKPSNISNIKTYTFPIPVKSLSDGAILVIEKDGEKFEIPFRYQHTFSFELWGT